MESELSADANKDTPPVPIKTYQWEDLRRARESGGYPWTHLLKVPIEGEITAETILTSTTPRRSMSREFTKSRTHSPIDTETQKILNLDSSPGSSRRHGEEGQDEGVHIPNFSKEISLESEEEVIHRTPDQSLQLATPVEIPINVSPKSILKRRAPEQQYIGVSETREKTKCCHPLVNKIKHLADKTLQKLERNETEKSPISKRKKNEDLQEIRQLRNSPGAVRRQKFSAIKLGDSDEVSKTFCEDTFLLRKKKDHIYEDIEETRTTLNNVSCSNDFQDNKNTDENTESNIENKSNISYDPSLVADDNVSLKTSEHIMEKLHQTMDKETKMVVEMTNSSETESIDAPHNDISDSKPKTKTHHLTITEITDDDTEQNMEESTTLPIEASPTPSPMDIKRKKNEMNDYDWSKSNSDHEYEIIEKPPPDIIYTAPSIEEKPIMVKTDGELSSTTSLERKGLEHISDEDENINEKENVANIEDFANAEALQKDIEERFFVNTPSTVSRTECEVSTSQVDSSALENLPLKRESRGKVSESKFQQRFKESTGKLKTQAGKLKTKFSNFKVNMPERPKFKMPERPKFTVPDRRKFSLPERPKMRKLNIPEKLSMGDRKKFSFPERPKFNVPDLSKFKLPERPKINFSSLRKKKEPQTETNTTGSTSDLQNIATVEFEVKTYPRIFSKKKKAIPKTSSSPNLNRDETPPPTFTFTRAKKPTGEPTSYLGDSEQPREYGNINDDDNNFSRAERKRNDTSYDFDKIPDYMADEDLHLNTESNEPSNTNITQSNQEYTHINEINNDEFFVRPRGISRENIQVREYLSDEIRQAFTTPKNVLAMMGSDPRINVEHMYANDMDFESEVNDENEADNIKYSTEDINEPDDGYYTFPPIRPSRAKRKKKDAESIKYIDDSVTASMQFSEVDLGLPEDQTDNQLMNEEFENIQESRRDFFEYTPSSTHLYSNDETESPSMIQSHTLPMPPRRKKKGNKRILHHQSLNDFKAHSTPEELEEKYSEDIVVYRTEHEYTVPQADTTTDRSPLPPRRTRSKSSREPSLYDDDRTSHGAESLILDPHLPHIADIDVANQSRHESPGYATVDKITYPPNAAKPIRRSTSKTPPVRRRKSHSSERKYYTVNGNMKAPPNRPPRKRSSTSLMTLDSFTNRSISGDFTQYVEIEEPQTESVHKNLKSGDILNKMKDRPLPPPPRPPRGARKSKNEIDADEHKKSRDALVKSRSLLLSDDFQASDIIEIEVSTQTDALPDDVDFELSMDENLDISMSSSLRDVIQDDSMAGKDIRKAPLDQRFSRPSSRSEKSLKLSDPKMSELSKSSGFGRTSPTVILVEKRVSSPTRINERDEILTEASLTVQHIDVEESQIPDVPPLPKSRKTDKIKQSMKPSEEQAIDRLSDTGRDIQIDNLVTQRLQVRDLDVGRLNVSELQASKILVSDIEGMTLHVNELDSKSGHISVSGIEFSQSVIDEIAKKFAEISTNTLQPASQQRLVISDIPRPVSREEQTQTDVTPETREDMNLKIGDEATLPSSTPSPPPRPMNIEDSSTPPQRPPPPDLTPLLYSYLQNATVPSPLYFPRTSRERHISEDHPSPAPPTRRSKRKQAVPQSESSSDDGKVQPSPRRMPMPIKGHEPTISEAGVQFFRVCHNSISRAVRNIYTSFMTYISGAQDKRDVQMAMVICLVLIAGLIMFGLSDSRAVHHHHWEFFNPPDIPQ
ncbi:uncharacterized protein LOC126979023 isoform X1 [Leptidea sinapis]|uniref:uncharacterized protein LOC126979023 isoform X1 n=2 Tax=Leptidea sinapis TaxID=189913 RepID=UPI0021C41AEA|nr:uncharacterized protein LOC126979023 isoform X1 [Leptidea sinapis]